MDIKCNKCNILIKKLDDEKDKDHIFRLSQDIGGGFKVTGKKFIDVLVCENCGSRTNYDVDAGEVSHNSETNVSKKLVDWTIKNSPVRDGFGKDGDITKKHIFIDDILTNRE